MATVQPALAWGNRQSQLHVVARPDGLLEIVLGLHCIEVVPRDPGSVQYRMAMGRLVNAGWEVTALGERLGHDTRTLRGWAEALLCADAAEMPASIAAAANARIWRRDFTVLYLFVFCVFKPAVHRR